MTMLIDRSTWLVRSATALCTEVDGQIVMIDLDANAYLGFDSTASEIWRRLEQPKRVDALCEELKAHFEGDADIIERETLAFLDVLIKDDLVKPA